jgi:hypothetical protein
MPPKIPLAPKKPIQLPAASWKRHQKLAKVLPSLNLAKQGPVEHRQVDRSQPKSRDLHLHWNTPTLANRFTKPNLKNIKQIKMREWSMKKRSRRSSLRNSTILPKVLAHHPRKMLRGARGGLILLIQGSLESTPQTI